MRSRLKAAVVLVCFTRHAHVVAVELLVANADVFTLPTQDCDTHVSLFAPVNAPRVSDNRVCHTVFDTPAHSQNCVVDRHLVALVTAAVVIQYSASVALELRLVSSDVGLVWPMGLKQIFHFGPSVPVVEVERLWYVH